MSSTVRASVALTKHIAWITAITTLIGLCIVYPFLPGSYDRLAVPLSTMAQVFGLVGLPLAAVGLAWWIIPKYRFVFGIVSMVAGIFALLVLALFATLSVGNAFGILTLLIGLYGFAQLFSGLKQLRNGDRPAFNAAPAYLITLPVFTLVFQLLVASSLTGRSRERVMVNANRFISHIEEYRRQNGTYPISLQAQNKDYFPDVVGVEKYHYAPQGDGYNLSFEQPRFLLDRFGTREWVVYNPKDEHRVYSHTSWQLPPPEEPEAAQGWYASGNTGRPHWKYFFFD